jgi:DNA-binding NtrC family response regulator
MAERTFVSDELMQDLRRAAQLDVPVLISAPSLDDCEQLAALIHRASFRAATSFFKLSCGSLAPASLEAALFGAGAAAGLLERADGGTLLLGQVDAIGVEVQRRLQAFLDSKEVRRVGAERPHAIADVRLITSTDGNLFEKVRGRRFEPGLFYRLNVIHVVLPTRETTCA